MTNDEKIIARILVYIVDGLVGGLAFYIAYKLFIKGDNYFACFMFAFGIHVSKSNIDIK